MIVGPLLMFALVGLVFLIVFANLDDFEDRVTALEKRIKALEPRLGQLDYDRNAPTAETPEFKEMKANEEQGQKEGRMSP